MRIEHRELARDARRYHSVVALDVVAHRFCDVVARAHEEREAFRVEKMIGRGRADLRDALGVLALEERQRLGRVIEFENRGRRKRAS